MESQVDRAKLIFLDEIVKQLDDLKEAQQAMTATIIDLQASMNRRKKFRMVPDRNSSTGLIEEVMVFEEVPDPEPDPTVLTPAGKKKR
jgi:hypothetical protein